MLQMFSPGLSDKELQNKNKVEFHLKVLDEQLSTEQMSAVQMQVCCVESEINVPEIVFGIKTKTDTPFGLA